MKLRDIPVKLGQELELQVTGLAHNGAGVGKYKGFTIFVPGALPEERVTIKIEVLKKQYATARLLTILQENPERVDPPCPVFGACGGCQTQHLSYSLQLEQKRKQVADQLQRIGGLSQVDVQPVLGMPEGKEWRYRNKSQIPFALQGGKAVSGFFAANSHQIVEFPECIIQSHIADAIIAKVRDLVKEWKIPVYDERRHQGILRHIMIRVGFRTEEVMVVFVTRSEEFPYKKKVVQELISAFPKIRSIYQNVNRERTNVVLGKESKLLWGVPTIIDHIGKARFAISPHSFFQVNPLQTEVLYEKVKQLAQLTGMETVLDLYCGIGTIGIYLADRAKKVVGIESVPEAIADAKQNAMLNHYDHLEFYVGKAEKVMPHLVKQGIFADVVIVDPPRKGCQEELLQAVVDVQPKKLIYVSCNPATLARDAKWLVENGFQLQQVQPVDMFPQTSHIETVALLERQ